MPSSPPPDRPIGAYLFTTDPGFARAGVDAGAEGVIVDWERRGKQSARPAPTPRCGPTRRPTWLGVGAATTGRLLCRVNGWGPWSAGEIDQAVALGADEVLLPMVRQPAEVDAALVAVAGRCGLGILVETSEAVRRVGELVRRPLSRLYVGLNDLMIDRGGRTLFAALVDGTVDTVREATPDSIPFGVAGLTLPERGTPIPCRLLAAELARLDAGFTFLRRSFTADVAGRDLAVELPRVLGAVGAARRSSPRQQAASRAELEALVALQLVDEAV